VRNTATPFRDFYTWHFKDWFISGARARLTLPQRAIYLDLLGFCYTEGGITADKAVLSSRLGIGREHDADLDTVLKEFEVHPEDDNRLMHPRMLLEAGRLEAARERKSKGGMARAAKLAKTVAAASPRPQADADDEPPF
jgi:uncharacterized protein YdaU (DUF1376 family)